MQTIASRYQIQQELGVGGMGTVYRGFDSQTGATVAIKKLKPQLSNPELIERFKREGEALRALKHPNIVQLLDTVEAEGEHFLVMEYVSGGDLSQKLEKGGLSQKEILRLGIDLCDALTRAHKLDIIHRDLKPANILIADDGTVRLTDFGVAHFGGKQRMTTADSVIGTIDYLAPEVFQSSEIDKRADIWAVGVILFEMLTGTRPFEAKTVNQTLALILSGEIPDIEELCPSAPTALVDLVYRMLNRNPDERIPSIRLVGAELEAVLQENPLSPGTNTNFAIEVAVSNFKTTPIPLTKNNLPHPGTPFVGREIDLAAVNSLLRDPKIQLLTIIAQGGMGKTRLSIEAAKSLLELYPQGVHFVELAPLSKAEDISSAIAEVVGYPFGGRGNPKQQIAEYFRDKTCLLIMDNFEHIMEGRELVQAIIQASQTKIIVTSRERLALSGETLYHLEGMEFPNWESPEDAMQYAAMRLFMESARRVRADFTLLPDDLPYAARICRLVHGLPLGIVLAASWLDALSLKEIGEEIASNVDFLESNMHDLPERQRSIRAVFDYSWKMLSDDEKQAFARLSVFRGGMSREAAQSVSETNLRSLQTLLNKSLLRRDNTSGRFEIHELLRQYGQEFLKTGNLLDAIRAKHAVYYADFVAKRLPEIKGKRQTAALLEIDADFENIKAAWRYTCEKKDSNTTQQMLEPIYWYCNFRHRTQEGFELFQLAREVWNDTSLAAGRLLLGFPPPMQDYTEYYERSIAIIKPYDVPLELAFASHRLGHWLSHSLGKNEQGIALMEESARMYETIAEKFYLAIVLDDLGWSYRLIGRTDLQLEAVSKSVELLREIGNKIGMANALRNMGGAVGGIGSGSRKPLEKWTEALILSEEIGDKRNIAWNNLMIGVFWQLDGEPQKALPYRDAAFAVASEIREETVIGAAYILDAIRNIVDEGNYQAARQLLDKGFPPGTPGDFRVIVKNIALTLLSIAEQDFPTMKAAALPIFEMGRGYTHPIVGVVAYSGIVFHVRDGNYEAAAELYGFVSNSPTNALFKSWQWIKDFMSDVQTKMGKTVYEEAFAHGATRSLKEAVESAFDYIQAH